MTYKTYLFDMDGTLLDTLDDLTAAVNHTLAQYGYPARTCEEVRRGLGNGAVKLMAAMLPEGEATTGFSDIMRDYKSWYQAHTCVETRPYPGITALLAALRQQGCQIAIVSNKPHTAACELAERFFPGVLTFGESPETPRKPAPDMVYHALTALGAEKDAAVYVGNKIGCQFTLYFIYKFSLSLNISTKLLPILHLNIYYISLQLISISSNY